MTKEEAAKRLFGGWYISTNGNLCVDEGERDAFCEAIGVAINALRVQQAKMDRSQWEGCEYCADHKYNVELCPMLSHDEDDCDRGMYIYDGCLISNSGEFQEAKINFCPMCGRPLTEKAWEETERRMNGGTNDN